jgi:hypothetical protein
MVLLRQMMTFIDQGVRGWAILAFGLPPVSGHGHTRTLQSRGSLGEMTL